MAPRPLIELRALSKARRVGRGQTYLLNSVSAQFERGGHYAILGLRRAGKSTLLQIIGGTQRATSGQIRRDGLIAPIIGSTSFLSLARSPTDLIHLYASVYRQNRIDYKRFVESIMKYYCNVSTGMLSWPMSDLEADVRRALASALAYGVQADCYLVDTTVAPSTDPVFAEWCVSAFKERSRAATTIFATHTAKGIDKYADRAGVLHAGKLRMYDDFASAIKAYEGIQLEATTTVLDAAHMLIRSKRQAEAHNLLSNYSAENPDDLDALQLLAKVAGHIGDSGSAISTLSHLVDQKPGDLDAGYLLARAMAKQGQLDKAIDQAAKVVNQVPDHRGARSILASSLEKMGRFSEAALQWRTLAEYSNSASDYHLSYRCECRAQNWEGALDALDRITALSPLNSDIVERQLSVLVQLGRKQPFVQAVVRLGGLDMPRALHFVLVWAGKWDWRAVAYEMLPALEELGLHEPQYQTAFAKILKAFERRAAAAARLKDQEEVDELDRCIAKFRSATVQT